MNWRHFITSLAALVLSQATTPHAFSQLPPNSFAPPVGTAAMNTARYDAAAAALPSGNLLLAGGGGPTGAFLDTLEIYRWRFNDFVPASALPTMSSLRANETATLLPNGKVLIAGGAVDNSTWTDTTDIYDPPTRTITAGPKMSNQREGATAKLLPNGLVLIAGGRDANGTLASVDLYNPATNTITPGPPMNVARYDCASVILPSGNLMVIGGFGAVTQSSPRASTEIYNPTTNAWQPVSVTPRMNNKRAGAQATRLPNGQILISGGTDNTGPLATTEVYHPQRRIFTVGPTMNSPRRFHTQVFLPNGKVLIAGGYTDSSGLVVTASSDLFDPANKTITAGPSMNDVRGLASRLPLRNGMVIIAGGNNGSTPLDTTELYQP